MKKQFIAVMKRIELGKAWEATLKPGHNVYTEIEKNKGNPLALDIFCGGGGASMGLHRLGFDVHGIDINDQPEYPFKFFKQDAFDSWQVFDSYDLIWASPPCQEYTWATGKWRNRGKRYIDAIGEIRKCLIASGRPFVIENVTTAPIRKDLILKGNMFGLRCIKARAFEIHGFTTKQPIEQKKNGTVKNGDYVTCAGHGGDGKAKRLFWQIAMGINWISDKKMLAEAIPPVYSEYIGREFLWSRLVNGVTSIPPKPKGSGILEGVL